MAWTLTQSKAGGAVADGITTTFDATPSVNSLLVASTQNTTNASTPVVSDAGGNWTLVRASGGNSCALALYVKIATTSQATAITADVGTALCSLNVYEFAGGKKDAALVTHTSASVAGASAATTDASQPSVTTTMAGTLVFTHLGTANTISSVTLSDGTFTAGQQSPSGAIELADYYKLNAAVGTYNPSFSWTTSRAWHQQTVAFRPTSAGILAML